MSNFVQPLSAPTAFTGLSENPGLKKRTHDLLYVLMSAIQISRRCQSEMNSTGQIGAETIDDIQAEVQNWP